MSRRDLFFNNEYPLVIVDKNGGAHHFANYLVNFRREDHRSKVDILKYDDYAKFSDVFSKVGNNRNNNMGAFKRLPPEIQQKLFYDCFRSCKLKRNEAHLYILEYQRLVEKNIDRLLVEAKPIISFLRNEQLDLKIKTKVKYVADANGTRLVMSFTPYVVSPLDYPGGNQPYFLDFRKITCEYKLNEAGPSQYVLVDDDSFLVKTYPQFLYHFMKNKMQTVFESEGRSVDGVDRLIEVAAALKVPLDLSNMNLSGLDLSGRNFANANLTGANLAGANLADATLSDVNARGIKLDRVAYLSRSKAPVPESDVENKKSAAPEEIAAWKEAVEKQGGLHPAEISRLITLSTIHCNSTPVERAGYTAGKTKSGSVSFGLFENEKAKVIHVEKILHPRKYELIGDDKSPEFIGFTNFAMLIADIAKMRNDDGSPKKIDLIQMPLAVMESGRQHYVQLQIYKTADDSIGARIIDSTANPIAIPVDFIKDLLLENRVELKAVLGATKYTVSVSEVHTNEQLALNDKKCGIYYVAGMKAAAEKALAEGASFLQSDDKAKNAVVHQHHLVSKIEAMGCLMGMVDVKASPVAAVISQTLSVLPTAAASSSDFLQSLLPDENADDYEAAVQQDANKAQTVMDSAYAHINTLLSVDKMDAGKLKDAVEAALNSYQKSRGWTFNFFRQLTSAGKDYAADALERMKKGTPEVAREIAREILFMGVRSDHKTIEVKHNSRVHHLLMALEGEQENVSDGISSNSTSSLINTPEGITSFKNVGVMGCSFKASSLQSGEGKTNIIRGSISSTHSS